MKNHNTEMRVTAIAMLCDATPKLESINHAGFLTHIEPVVKDEGRRFKANLQLLPFIPFHSDMYAHMHIYTERVWPPHASSTIWG